MSDQSKVKLSGDSKAPTDKDQLDDKELDEVAGGTITTTTTTDPPEPGTPEGRFSDIAGKYSAKYTPGT